MPRMTNQEMALRTMRQNLGTLLDTSPAYRQFLWTLFVEAGIFYPTYSRRSPHDTSYNEGRRSVGLEMLHLLKAVRPDILSIIEREGNLLDAAPPKPREDPNELPPDADDEFDAEDVS